MTQYEIIERVPSGIKVKVYHNGQEVLEQNVPAQHCQTRAVLESFLRRVSADKIRAIEVPRDVLNIKGRQPL